MAPRVAIPPAEPGQTTNRQHSRPYGILNDQILFASHIISSAFQLRDSQFDILSLNTGMYPFNYLMYKRGLTWREKIYPLISRNNSHQLVYYANSLKLHTLPPPIAKIYQDCDKPRSEQARHQASRINRHLWPLLFEPKLRDRLPRLVTLNQEDIIIPVLCGLIEQKDNFIHRVIFDRNFRQAFYEAFLDTPGGWSPQKNKGSFLFWTINNKSECVGLALQGNELRSYQRTLDFSLELEEEAVLNALKNKKIYPGMVLAFGVLVFHSGLKPLCGYGSINYLNLMKNKWAELLKVEFPDESRSIDTMVMNGLVCGPVLLYYRNSQGKLTRAFAADLVTQNGIKIEYLKKVFAMPFNKLLEPVLIDIYNTYLPREAKRFIDISPDDIVQKQFDWI